MRLEAIALWVVDAQGDIDTEAACLGGVREARGDAGAVDILVNSVGIRKCPTAGKARAAPRYEILRPALMGCAVSAWMVPLMRRGEGRAVVRCAENSPCIFRCDLLCVRTMPAAPNTAGLPPQAAAPQRPGRHARIAARRRTTRRERPAAARPTPPRIAELLGVVAILLGYGRHLADTLEQRAVARGFATIAQFFGTVKFDTILAHVMRGLMRAMALERMLLRRAARGRDLRLLAPRAGSRRAAAAGSGEAVELDTLSAAAEGFDPAAAWDGLGAQAGHAAAGLDAATPSSTLNAAGDAAYAAGSAGDAAPAAFDAADPDAAAPYGAPGNAAAFDAAADPNAAAPYGAPDAPGNAAAPGAASGAAPDPAAQPPRRGTGREPLSLHSLPTMEAIEAEVRRSPIGRTIAAICRDLGVAPLLCHGPFWNRLFDAIRLYSSAFDDFAADMRQREQRFAKEDWKHPELALPEQTREGVRRVLGFFVGETPVDPFAVVTAVVAALTPVAAVAAPTLAVAAVATGPP
jgi:hypothetical protein